MLIARGVPETKISLIYNWADEAALAVPQGQLPTHFTDTKQFNILFAGNMGKAQALATVLQAAALLQNRNSNVRFVMLGGGVEVDGLKQLATDLKLQNTIFLASVPMTEVGTLLNAADALLVHLREDPLFEITIPSKTQAYMTAGKPLLMAVNGDAADLVLRASGGIVAHSENAEELAKAAEQLAALSPEMLLKMGQSAQSFYKEHLALSVGVNKFGAIFKKLASKGLNA